MERVLVQLTAEELAQLRQRSTASGRSVAALVREAVDEWIARDEHDGRVERALASVGQFRSGLGDLAENHDRYLTDEAE
jgi:hypothetical protein